MFTEPYFRDPEALFRHRMRMGLFAVALWCVLCAGLLVAVLT